MEYGKPKKKRKKRRKKKRKRKKASKKKKKRKRRRGTRESTLFVSFCLYAQNGRGSGIGQITLVSADDRLINCLWVKIPDPLWTKQPTGRLAEWLINKGKKLNGLIFLK